MNLSNPKPIKINQKKQSAFSSLVEKLSAIISLVELGGGMAIPGKINKKLSVKQRDIVVIITILIFIYFLLMGIFSTIYFLSKLF